jgi:hypothetical protein
MRVSCQPLIPDHNNKEAVTGDDDNREGGRREIGVKALHAITTFGQKVTPLWSKRYPEF